MKISFITSSPGLERCAKHPLIKSTIPGRNESTRMYLNNIDLS